MRAIGIALFATCTACAQGDVIIHSRSTDFYSSYTAGPIDVRSTFNDHAYVNQLGPSGSGLVDLTTFHNEHFTSTASPNLISAQMRGNAGYGGSVQQNYWSQSSWFAVVFEVTQSTTATTINFNGNISPRAFEGRITGFTFQLINVTTGETEFDVLDDLPPAESTELWHSAIWDHVSWSGLLNPGRYVLTTQAHCEWMNAPQSHSGGGSGSTSVAFSMTFGPGVAPALAPSPSAAALLSLACGGSPRRRRQTPGAHQ